MNVATHRSSPVTVRPTLLLGLTVFLFALTLQEVAVSTSTSLWAGHAKLLVLLVLVGGGCCARYAGRRLSANTAGVILALTVVGAGLILR